MRRLRRLLTVLALIVMVTLIGGYAFFTDRARVRRFAEDLLSRELGAKVTIGDARLSIFEGLRLTDLRVTALTGTPKPIFEAKQIVVSYDPRALLKGKVAADRIVAVEPKVRLIEDLDERRWNFQLLENRRPSGSASRSTDSGGMPALPEILVRNASFDYAQIENGRETDVGTLHLEGAFTPDATGRYRFRVQSRGGAEHAFPVAEGSIKSDGSAVHLVVNDVEFVDEIKSILPANVRRYWQEHQLSGRLDEVAIDLFRKPDGHAGYRVTTDCAGVSLIVPPTRWMGHGDQARVREWKDAYTALASPELGGSAVARSLIESMTPEPLKLQDVDARFVFTDEGVRIENLLAHVDGNALRFTGKLDGYSAAAGIEANIESLPGQDLVLPESPEFIRAMPWPVQEIYYRFRPAGKATLSLHVVRDHGAEQPKLSGELVARDATFVFDRIPYPVERAQGRLRFGNDPNTGREMLELVNITGHGPADGPNRDATLTVRGTISPLDETAGADIHVSGKNVTGEPRLIRSLPPLTQKAVLNFDALHTGNLPRFSGDFGCDVSRTVGLGQPWLVTTGLTLRDGAGVFKGFPYPLTGVTGAIKIFDDHVDITNIVMPAGGGTAELSGAITWTRRDPKTGEPLVQPDLTLKTRGVNIDAALVNALPPAKRGFISQLGLSGKLEIDGKIEASAPDSEDPSVDLKVSLTDGRAVPPGMKLVVDALRAKFRVKGEQGEVTSFDGTLAGAPFSGRATVDATAAVPRVIVDAKVTSILAEKAPLGGLPADAIKAVKSLHAKGPVDIDWHYESIDDYRLELRPVALSVTPEILPLKFDTTGGRAVVVPGSVRLEKVTAKVGNAPVSLDGTVDTATGDSTIVCAARDLKIDAQTTKALPAVLQDVVRSLSISGPVAIDCRKLVVKQPTTQPVAPSRTTFDATLWLQKASMQVAADMKDVVGSVSMTGQVDGDTLSRLDGKVSIDDATFAGRPVSRLTADLTKRPGMDLLQITNLSARIAGGQIAGRIDTVLNKKDPRYALELLIRGAKVADLTGEKENPIDGSLNASLAMEGRWDDPKTRRGRGDVLVQGREMAKVPLVFGLLQVANLAVPNNEPIRQAGMRYTVEGPIIRMDQIDLRSTKAVMAGDGVLDFDKQTIELDLALAESAADAIPLFGDLIKNTRQDWLKLKIKGSLATGKQSGQAFNIFNSTVDEVQKK